MTMIIWLAVYDINIAKECIDSSNNKDHDHDNYSVHIDGGDGNNNNDHDLNDRNIHDLKFGNVRCRSV